MSNVRHAKTKTECQYVKSDFPCRGASEQFIIDVNVKFRACKHLTCVREFQCRLTQQYGDTRST